MISDAYSSPLRNLRGIPEPLWGRIGMQVPVRRSQTLLSLWGAFPFITAALRSQFLIQYL